MERREFLNDAATNEWLGSQQKSETKRHYARCWANFLRFTGMTGDEILADRKLDTEHRWERRVLTYKDWLVNEKKAATYSATLEAMAARSFFSYHYSALQYRTAERKKLGKRVRKTQDYQFIRDDLKRMFDVGDLTEKYVVTAGKSFGLRAGDFLSLRRGDLEPYLSREAPISIGEIATEKEGVRAYPFIDSDAQPVIRLVVERMTREGRTEPTDRILDYKKERQLSRILQRLVKKAGIVAGSKRVRFHCLRKYLADRLASAMSESKWKQILGKAIDEGAYISADSLREDYSRAMTETCFADAGLEDRVRRQEIATELQGKIMAGQALTEGDRNNIQRYRLKLFMPRKKSAPQSKKECEDGEHCQRVVGEDELPSFLDQGWHASIVLPSGKIVVER
jgi:integrase